MLVTSFIHMRISPKIITILVTRPQNLSPAFSYAEKSLRMPVLKVKVKGKIKVKVTLDQATKAQRGSRGIALLFL